MYINDEVMSVTTTLYTLFLFFKKKSDIQWAWPHLETGGFPQLCDDNGGGEA